MPTGIQPPTVVAYNASSVPVVQLSLSSDRLNEQRLYDYGIYNLRQQLAPIHGVTFPTPDGGKHRQTMVDIDSTKLAADQSKLVTASIASVVREGAIAAGLTGLMIMPFLGSWRSTLIVLISISLSILTLIVVLYFLGDTLNTMTLGGMALAVGILVDDSTVAIENTHRLRGEGMSLAAATLHGSAGIAVPTLVSTPAISCVFTSVVFLDGPANRHQRVQPSDAEDGNPFSAPAWPTC
jgi:multidrug efflux pump subunit AcrB